MRGMSDTHKAIRKPVTANDYPGPWSVYACPSDLEGFRKALDERNRRIEQWVREQNAVVEGRPQ